MKKITTVIFLGVFCQILGFAQAGLGLRHLVYDNLQDGISKHVNAPGSIDFGIHYRWFDAAVPYSGNLRQSMLESQNIHEIFNSHNIVFAVNYTLNRRFSFFASIPLVYNQKSSVLEHSMVNGQFVALQRRITEGIGLGDLITGAHFTILDGTDSISRSLKFGLGIKIPTGAYNQRDIWYNAGPQRSDVLRTVDAAIQPGDGSWGFLADLRGSVSLLSFLGVYGEARYLFNPADNNGVRTFRSFISEEFSEEEEMSVTDQYMFRGGISLGKVGSPLVFSSGIRMDGVPVNDLIGESSGFRRPGYAVSWENTVMVQSDRFSVYFSLPYIYYQQRHRSNPEARYAAQTGSSGYGDASFSRFMICAGLTARL
jgi:hypothetical protein